MTSLAPSFLVSMPQLLDRNFYQSVVLLCSHSKEEGAFGLVVNRPSMTVGRVVVSLDPPVWTDRTIEVWVGGPVEPQRSCMLVGRGPEEAGDEERRDDQQIASGLYVSTSPTLLRRMLDPTPPARTKLVVGYAGWGPGQLESELEESAWLLADVDVGMIFETPADQMWAAVIRRLGADPATLHVGRGFH
jgi:putative transcriptional regulator